MKRIILDHKGIVQIQVLLLSRNTLNTNLMLGHRDSSVSPYSLPEITEHGITFYFIASKSG